MHNKYSLSNRENWENICNSLVDELNCQNITKIALIGIKDYEFENYLLNTLLKSGISTITPEFNARTEIETCSCNETMEILVSKYAKLGAQAVICENLHIHNAACKCGICVQCLDK